MLPVFVLLFAAYLPGRIASATRHPMLLAIKLWAVAHLLANGTLADLLLFGGFLAWAVADRISVKRRPRTPPPRTAGGGRFNDLIAIVGGLAALRAVLLVRPSLADRRRAALSSELPSPAEREPCPMPQHLPDFWSNLRGEFAAGRHWIDRAVVLAYAVLDRADGGRFTMLAEFCERRCSSICARSTRGMRPRCRSACRSASA